MITLNKNLEKGLINGMMAIILRLAMKSIVLQLSDGRMACLPMTRHRKDGIFREAFSLAGGYAMTIHKSQGLTMKRVVIYWDSPRCQPGLGYTALSRAQSLNAIQMIGEPKTTHFVPVG